MTTWSFRWRTGQRNPRLPRSETRPTVAILELLREALAGILDRPGRSLLTMLGTVLGSAAVVSIVGISQTAGAQIDARFSLLDATQVTVTDAAAVTAKSPALNFPPDSESRVERLNGVTGAGVWWRARTHDGTVSARLSADNALAVSTPIYAATPGVFAAAQTPFATGTPFNIFHQKYRQPVAVLSEPIAAQLRITSLIHQPAIFLDGRAFTVIGIIGTPNRVPALGLGIVIPSSVAEDYFGLPTSDAPASMIIATRVGAAQVVATQIALALNPYQTADFAVAPPLNVNSLRSQVKASLNGLLLALAGVAVVIGALGIANTTLVAVLERRGEIGLRRALGALRRHIAAQFLVEAGALGFLGGVFGAAIGITATVTLSLTRNWTTVLPPLIYLTPAGGALVGLVAGIYPSLRAARLEPVEALHD